MRVDQVAFNEPNERTNVWAATSMSRRYVYDDQVSPEIDEKQIVRFNFVVLRVKQQKPEKRFHHHHTPALTSQTVY